MNGRRHNQQSDKTQNHSVDTIKNELNLVLIFCLNILGFITLQ
jgi:hypothetical protein